MPLSQATLAALVLEDTDGRLEIFQGKLQEKPPMSFGHNEAIWELGRQLTAQLSRNAYRVRQNAGHLFIANGDSYIPDVIVVPVDLIAELQAKPRTLEAYSEPLPFVAEVWSPSTGSYDIDCKIPGYQTRGDLEIWRVHPFDRQITLWRRQADGHYVESVVRDGTVTLHALPDVTIDVADLFSE